jgi:hypothetical protein
MAEETEKDEITGQEEAQLVNIDIADFSTVSGLTVDDYIVLVLDGGAAAKIPVESLNAYLSSKIKPYISGGIWYVGSEPTDVEAWGRTAEFRKGELGVEWKYTNDDDESWRLLVNYTDIALKFQDLTDEQRALLIPHLSDFSDEEIAELQKPATETIEKIEKAVDESTKAESSRVTAEQARVSAESSRASAESSRVKAEASRATAENTRQSQESTRQSQEATRVSQESARVTAESARTKAESARVSAESLRASEETARQQYEAARQSAESARQSAESERSTAELVRIANEKARVSAESARVSEFASLKSASESATDYANEVASHPTYVGTDNYVYVWNHATQSYDKTYILVKAGGLTIDVQYASVAELQADTRQWNDGLFAMVNTDNVEDPEDARLYIRKNGAWQFVVDMSGAIGLTGKTPQFFIGSVSVGANNQSAAVSLSEAGTDADGNPQYNIHYTIPCLAYSDLTPDEIADLQRPASDMIVVLEQTNADMLEAESSRAAAETARTEAEAARVTADEARAAAESSREDAEAARTAAETERTEAEDARAESEVSRFEAESARSAAEESRVNAELARAEVESSRSEAEAAREDAEAARSEAESSRSEAEALRVTADEARTAAESAREDAETARAEAEEVRVKMEDLRVTADKQRLASVLEAVAASESATAAAITATAEVNEAVAASESATATALTAASHSPRVVDAYWQVWSAEDNGYVPTGICANSKSPVIREGVWWVWDDVNADYVSTGVSVSSQYVLTKTAVEGVLTGDVTSHSHSQYLTALYVAQVFDAAPDFATLSSWTDDGGVSHPFQLGNDIYVRDEDEPSGYANYRYGITSSGNGWLRMVQVPSGYKVVLVSNE